MDGQGLKSRGVQVAKEWEKFKHFPAFILRLHLVIYSAGHSANSNTSQLSFWGSIWWFILPGILQIQTLPSFHFEAPFGDLFCRAFCKFKHFPAFILRLHLVIYSAGHSANSNTSQLSFWGSISWFILPGILQIQTLPSFHFEAPFRDLFCRAFCKFKHFPAFILRLHLVIYSAGHSANSNTSQLSFWGSIWWFILPVILPEVQVTSYR